MKKVLIADYVHQHLIDGFEKIGFLVDYQKDILWEDTLKIIDQYEGVIINSKTKMNREMLDRAKNLKFIGRLGSGLEIIDLAYANAKGVQVYNSPEGNRNAVAEHALGMLLSFSNNLYQSNKEVRNLEWHREKNRGFELEGKTIGIIGFGNTGRAFAKVLQGFDVELLVYDKYKKDYVLESDAFRESGIKEIQEKADIISFHLPLTKETHYLVDEEFINSCKIGVILVNTSRGKVLKTKALIEGLRSKRIGGLCLDVFENEKPWTYTQEEKTMYQELYAFKNLCVSPHVAGWTKESLYKIADTLLIKIKNMYSESASDDVQNH